MRQKEELICPKCESKNVAELVFGYANLSSMVVEQIKIGKKKLAGCETCNGGKEYHCNECGEEF